MKLSPEQRKTIDAACAPIRASALSTEEIDVAECKELLNSAYALYGHSVPEIVVVRSPQDAMAHLRSLSPEPTSEPRPVPDLDAVLKNGTSLAPVWNIIASAQPRVWPALGSEVDLSFHFEARTTVDAIPWSEEWLLVQDRAKSKVDDLLDLHNAVGTLLEEQILLESEAWLLHTSAATSLWAAAGGFAKLDAFLALGHVTSPPPGFDVAKQLHASCAQLYSFDRLCLVCQRPAEIVMTKDRRKIHVLLKWRDGTHHEYEYS